MDISLTIFIIINVLNLVFLTIGFVNKQYVLIIYSGILFLILGAFLLQGFSYETGYNQTKTTDNITLTETTTTQYVNQNWTSIFKLPLSAVYFLNGLAMVFIGIFSYYSDKRDKRTSELNEEED
jgi:hypothetical protein